MVTAEQIKALRDKTGISISECKKALEAASGNMEKAIEELKKKSVHVAAKKADRTLGSGVIATYVHSDKKLAVLVELLCESDFVARNDEFIRLADDIAMQVAALVPAYVNKAAISADEQAKAKAMFAEEVEKSGKSADIKQKMLEGKIGAYFKERTLYDQPFVKDDTHTVGQLIEQATQKFGEKIEVGRFVRYLLLHE